MRKKHARLKRHLRNINEDHIISAGELRRVREALLNAKDGVSNTRAEAYLNTAIICVNQDLKEIRKREAFINSQETCPIKRQTQSVIYTEVERGTQGYSMTKGVAGITFLPITDFMNRKIGVPLSDIDQRNPHKICANKHLSQQIRNGTRGIRLGNGTFIPTALWGRKNYGAGIVTRKAFGYRRYNSNFVNSLPHMRPAHGYLASADTNGNFIHAFSIKSYDDAHQKLVKEILKDVEWGLTRKS